MSPPRTGLLVAVGIAGTAVAGVAQQEELIRDACPVAHEVGVSREFRIGGPDDPGRIGSSPVAAIDPSGRLFLHNPSVQGVVNVFDSSGEFIRSFGSAGEGPGEYRRMIQAIGFGPGDTVHLFDWGNVRHTTLSPDFEVLETRRLPVPPTLNGVALLSLGRWVINAAIQSPDRVGYPLHLLRRDGSIQRSFGSLSPIYRADARVLMERSLAPAGPGAVWAAHRSRYRLELWGPSNGLRRALVREVSWFRPWTRVGPTGMEEAWPPQVVDVRLDDQGRLWVLVRVARPDWRAHVEEHEPGQFWIPNTARYFGSVIEVLDPDGVCVVGRVETETLFLGFGSDGRLMAYDQDELGVPYIEVWRPHVREK